MVQMVVTEESPELSEADVRRIEAMLKERGLTPGPRFSREFGLFLCGLYENVFRPIEARGVRVAAILVNHLDAVNFRIALREDLVPETMKELLLAGFLGEIQGTKIRISKNMRRGFVSAVGDDQHRYHLLFEDFAPPISVGKYLSEHFAPV